MRYYALVLLGLLAATLRGDAPKSFPDSQPQDDRLGELRNLNGYFPFKPVANRQHWKTRQAEIQRRILLSQGLWPLPTKTPIKAVIHGAVERDDYTVERVYFESIPGHFVTGSLYRPKGKAGPLPAILSPHGHWNQGRFYDAGSDEIARQLKNGAESFEVGGRFPIQARAVQLARMGCIVFIYDMTGNADSIQIGHRPAKWRHLDSQENWGFMSVQADLHLQNMMGLQTWNSIRAIDFLLELDDTDPSRIGVTGASGGGTQSMILAAIDQRISAAMPCVMVSTSMQGGCTCENAPLLRIDQGNIDIAAATAPRPLGLTAADDWTVELQTKGYPDLKRLYGMLGHDENLSAVFRTEFKHNYNQVNRKAMYEFFNVHFQLGVSDPIVERDFVPLTRAEATVWNDDHPAPSGNQIGDPHEIRLLRMAARDSKRLIDGLVPTSEAGLPAYRDIVGGAWSTILGRRLEQVAEVSFTKSGDHVHQAAQVLAGRIDHASVNEQIPTLILRSKTQSASGPKPGTVIWITDSGKDAIYQADRLIDPLVKLLDEGYVVIAADLFGQGEMLPPGQPSNIQPMWYQRNGDQGWHRFSGYTFGYNHCLFAKRVHDTLSLIKFAQTTDDGPIHLVGLGDTAGPLVAGALSQAGEAVDQTFIDLNGFRFAGVSKHADAMMVPGSVKYLDVDGLLSLCAPAHLTIFNSGEGDIAKRVYAAEGMSDQLDVRDADDPTAAVLQALLGDQ